MHFVAGRREELPSRLMEDMGRYRHKVFIEHLGWPLRSFDGIESDEFDGSEAVYICAHDECGQVDCVARLLPTTSDYLLAKKFAMLWGGSELPHAAEIWELSRFAAVNFGVGTVTLASQASAEGAVNFFRRVVEVARSYGATSLVTVSPVGMERLLRKNGYCAARAGEPLMRGTTSIVGLKIQCEPRRFEFASKIPINN